MRRIVLPAVVLALAATGCGDGGTALTAPTTVVPATTASTAPETTAPQTTQTTEPAGEQAVPGTLASLATAPVEDPLYGSGYHQMGWGSEEDLLLLSDGPIISTGDPQLGGDRLAIEGFESPPAVGGLASDQVLVSARVFLPSGAESPSALVVYGPGSEGFEAVTVIHSDSFEAALLETTDYAAVAPGGPVEMWYTPTEFDAAGRTLVTGIRVAERSDPGEAVYEGEIACDFGGDDLVCETLSDDGVLRPGDEGEAVEALQGDLAAAGYFEREADGKYGPQTAAAVRRFQRDYLLGVDGKAGPNTLDMLAAVVGGTTDLVVASADGVGPVAFGTGSDSAYAALQDVFGPPDSTTGWYVDGCDGHDWFKARWEGFSAVFTDRDGTRQFDGWEVGDLGDLPAHLLITGGIHAGTTWSYLDGTLGADFFDDYLGERWRIPDLGLTNGRFAGPVSDPPAGDSAIASFGTGTGGFESC
jgi:hypothetical protein